jgi:hypothetical protein
VKEKVFLDFFEWFMANHARYGDMTVKPLTRPYPWKNYKNLLDKKKELSL